MDKKCNFNDNCSKAKRIVEEANKDLKYFYVEGPTGPKGEAGPEGPQGLPGKMVKILSQHMECVIKPQVHQ